MYSPAHGPKSWPYTQPNQTPRQIYDSPTTGRPLIEYRTSYPGPWNSGMRTPFTKRINSSGKIYLTDSPGRHIQEAPQPFTLFQDPALVTYQEWQATIPRSATVEPVDVPVDESTSRRKTRPQRTTARNNKQAQASVNPDGQHSPLPAEESDITGSDSEYVLPLPKRQAPTPDAIVNIESDDGSSSNRFTAKQKGKHRQQEDPSSDEVPLRRGRLNKDTTMSLKLFGDTTRLAAQELADLHRINLATVMRYAGLGAGSETRASNDCNTFKTIYAAKTLADLGGMFLCYFASLSFLILYIARAHPDECVTAYWEWVKSVPDAEERSNWLITELAALQ